MKEKTSVTLSKDVLVSIDRLAGSKHSRSAVIERVLRRFLREQGRAQAQARDLDRLNHAAEQLNAEAAEVWSTSHRKTDSGASVKRGELYRVRKPGGDPKQHRV